MWNVNEYLINDLHLLYGKILLLDQFLLSSPRAESARQRLTFRFRNFSVSKLLPIFWGFRFRFRKIWYRKKSFSFGFGKFGIGKKVSVSEKFGLGKKSPFRKIWYWKKSIGFGEIWYRKKSQFRFPKTWYWKKNIGFGEIRYRKKVAVSVSKNLILEKNIGIGFGQNIGIVIQWRRHCLVFASAATKKQTTKTISWFWFNYSKLGPNC